MILYKTSFKYFTFFHFIYFFCSFPHFQLFFSMTSLGYCGVVNLNGSYTVIFLFIWLYGILSSIHFFLSPDIINSPNYSLQLPLPLPNIHCSFLWSSLCISDQQREHCPLLFLQRRQSAVLLKCQRDVTQEESCWNQLLLDSHDFLFFFFCRNLCNSAFLNITFFFNPTLCKSLWRTQQHMCL